MEFQRSFLRRHFMGKPVVESQKSAVFSGHVDVSVANQWITAKKTDRLTDWGAILPPKRNWRQCLCKILEWPTNSVMVCYGISGVINFDFVFNRNCLWFFFISRTGSRPWYRQNQPLYRKVFWNKERSYNGEKIDISSLHLFNIYDT